VINDPALHWVDAPLTVIATVLRAETRQWCLDLGAHYLIDHTKSLTAQLRKIAIPEVESIAGLNATETHYPALVEALAPQGKFGLIDDPKTLDAIPPKNKSASLHWEYMFARAIFETADILRSTSCSMR